ncbi:GPO family capsid scaffolding protein [Vibrio sp. 404]|uniref:GPO family capsid scaffolding protein n=1 Tax=Vibrio marinisediminis TaxID=2758441 RepID=A0A7W2FMJ3_9VIBR|nr:GPO family capsid scaffolding protein [Vibrio marinisediminis]MBA5760843.1 GPO family capsid scaffolding protein [Vibrio marinisediminis]
MFQSQPICILQAGTTVDGRVIEQKIIDEIAESYNPETYTARINEEHYDWSYKFGSVSSLEKREDKLFAVIKPNSMLLRAVEQGQLLHTSCEYIEQFSDTGKAYLTGLALTDKPASLGTTQIHLSSKDDGKVQVQSNFTIKSEQFSKQDSEDDASLFQKFKNWLSGETPTEQFSQQEEEDEMSKETEELLKQNAEQNKELSSQLGKLIEHLSSQAKPDAEPDKEEPEVIENKEVTELKGQVEELSSKMTELTTTLSQITDDGGRKLAGQDSEEEPYL